MATVLVTGANRGIGFELCRQLAERGDDVIAVCRSASDELRAIGVEIIDGIDVSDGSAVARLASELGGRSIDVLINNAGILRGETFGRIDYTSNSTLPHADPSHTKA